MSEVESVEAPSTKRPKESKFYQQNLWAWQPILTASNVCPYFYVVAIIFITLGSFLLVTSNGVKEKSIHYTHCLTAAGTSCAEEIKNNWMQCECKFNFTLDSDWMGPVYVFYGLTNFFQNHRRYVMSRDDVQLQGKNITVPSSNCEPYGYGVVNGVKLIVAPCGAIANSIFNDTFEVKRIATGENVIISKDNIAWKSDRDEKFGVYEGSWDGFTKPPNWHLPVQEMSKNVYSGYGDLLVWMRTAALPNFRKNYGDVINQDLNNGLHSGYYEVYVNYSYPVTQFGGTKHFVISQASWLGGKNPTLGTAYIIVGCVHAVLAVIFTGIHFNLRRKRRRGF